MKISYKVLSWRQSARILAETAVLHIMTNGIFRPGLQSPGVHCCGVPDHVGGMAYVLR